MRATTAALDIDYIKRRIEAGGNADTLAEELNIPRGTLATFLRRHKIKRPQKVKFIADRERASSKSRYIDEVGVSGKCTKCGRKAKLDKHHPEPNDCYLVEYICRKCHAREHPTHNKVYTALPNPARNRRMEMLVVKYGPQIAAAFINFYDFPHLTAIELSEMAGISRERVRQILVQLHGNYVRKIVRGSRN